MKHAGGYVKIGVVYFSGNNLYYPNTEEVFDKTIVQKNRFEWTKRRATFDGRDKTIKEIFVRDIYKQWYIKGINTRISSIDKLIEFLEKQLEGFDEIITVGNSAGGYMAALIGCKLNADRVFCFSGQFDLSDRIDNYPMMLQYQKDDSISKYYDITDLIEKSSVPVYYFYPAYVDQDIWQASRVAGCKNVKAFKFRQRLHGQSMYVEDLPSVLSFSNEKLDALFEIYSEKLIFPFVWSIKVSGIKIAIKGWWICFLKKIYVKFQKIKKLRRTP